MKKSFLLSCLFWLAFYGKVWAQVEPDSIINPNSYRNSVYAELGGNGVAGSVNYERLIYLAASDATMALRIGGIFIPEGYDGGKLKYEMLVPFEVSFFRGSKAVKFEMGFGVTYYRYRYLYAGYYGTNEPEKEDIFIPVCRIGGRWQLPQKPYFIRLAFTPIMVIVAPVNFEFVLPGVPWAGLSFGYSFGKRRN